MRLAVLGSPIAHSKSPAIHGAAYAALGLDWTYERFELSEPELRSFLAERDSAWRGFSLTMPLKFEALALSDEVDATARVTGAVNTLLLEHEQGGTSTRLRGFNTDVAGIVNSLAEHGTKQANDVFVIGGGATAGSAIMAAAELGARQVSVAVRTPAKAHDLHGIAQSAGLSFNVVPFAEVRRAASSADLLISTLPGGIDTGLDFGAEFMRRVPLYDVAYSPWPSPLGVQWQRAGAQLISGLGMLLHQALVQVRIFVNADPTAPLPNESAVYAAMSAAVSSGAH